MVSNVHLFLIEGKAQNTSSRLKAMSLLKAVVARDTKPGTRRHSENYFTLAKVLSR